MPSNLFYLTTRLSPQTTGVKVVPPGGLPEVTREDVLRAIGCIKDAVGWQCISAKWLGNDKALHGLLQTTEARSWSKWRRDKRKEKIDVFLNQAMAEVAVLGWLFPNNKRTTEGVRRYIGQDKGPFLSGYKPHIETLANWLQDKETAAWRDIDSFLKKAA